MLEPRRGRKRPGHAEAQPDGGQTKALREHRNVRVDWVVFSSSPVREREARASAERLLEGAKAARIHEVGFIDRVHQHEARHSDSAFATRSAPRPSPTRTARRASGSTS